MNSILRGMLPKIILLAAIGISCLLTPKVDNKKPKPTTGVVTERWIKIEEDDDNKSRYFIKASLFPDLEEVNFQYFWEHKVGSKYP